MNARVNPKKAYYSAPEVARVLGLSRNAVSKKIKSGAIEAQMVGSQYMITQDEVLRLLGVSLGEVRRKELDVSIRRVVKEYGTVLKRLEAV